MSTGLPGLRALINLAHHRSDGALVNWQNLRTQCQEALAKLAALEAHRARYDDLLRGGLERGMSAVAMRSFVGFINQIDQVVQTQQGEVARIEAACLRQWEQLVLLRRDKRLYEIIDERAVTRELEAAARRSQAEIDDLLQRAARSPWALGQ